MYLVTEHLSMLILNTVIGFDAGNNLTSSTSSENIYIG